MGRSLFNAILGNLVILKLQNIYDKELYVHIVIHDRTVLKYFNLEFVKKINFT